MSPLTGHQLLSKNSKLLSNVRKERELRNHEHQSANSMRWNQKLDDWFPHSCLLLGYMGKGQIRNLCLRKLK